MNRIRRFRLRTPTAFDKHIQIREIPPHNRTILLSNGRSFCLQLPYLIAITDGHPNRVEIVFVGVGLSKFPIKDLYSPVYHLPMPDISRDGTPSCHPRSTIGNGIAEKDILGFFLSPFRSDYFFHKELFRETFGSFREWSELSLEEVVSKLKGEFPLHHLLYGATEERWKYTFGCDLKDCHLERMKSVSSKMIIGK